MKKRSSYRPRPVLKDPVSYVLSGLKPLTQMKEEYFLIQIKNREALEQVRVGTADKVDMDRLIASANMAEALALQGKGREWLDDIQAAQEQLLALARRGAKNGMRFVMNAQEWEALKLIIDLHEVQLENSTVYDIEKAYDYVDKRIRAGKVMTITQPLKEQQP